MGLLIAILAVSLATQVVVPTLLRLLSLFFARRALWEAANAVRDAGTMAIEGMAQSRRWMGGAHGEWEPPAPVATEPAEERNDAAARPRVVPTSDNRVRVKLTDEGPEEEEAEAAVPHATTPKRQ
jgi:hypothetical protein